MSFSMATRDMSRKRRLGLTFAAWLSLVFGLYAVVLAASLWGLLIGGLFGALGVMIALSVLTDRPDGRTRGIAIVALVLGGLALAVCVGVLIAVGDWPWEL